MSIIDSIEFVATQTSCDKKSNHTSSDLERLFRFTFFKTHQTLLLGGRKEPLYQPASNQSEASILYYRENYFLSALHEVAHWCLAGRKRRQIVDFGYWYQESGRNLQQQLLFLSVESKPQALEKIFAQACGIKFHPSFDLNSDDCLPNNYRDDFIANIDRQVDYYLQYGLPQRAQYFLDTLIDFYIK